MKKLFNHKLFRIITTIIKVLFICIIISYLSFVVIQRLSGNKSIFGYRMFVIATGSMLGVYDPNDVILVKDCDTSKLDIGDDIAYKGSKGGLEGMLITHRIVKIEESENGGRIYTTRGVMSTVDDPSITDSQILGKVVGIVPIISQLNHIIKSQLGFFLLIFCPLVIVIVLEVLETITDIQEERNIIRRVGKEDFEENSEGILENIDNGNKIISDKEEKNEIEVL